MNISVKSIWILDSRSIPTIQCEATLTNNTDAVFQAKASVPSGASTGSHEALELRDFEPDNFHGKGVTHAISNISKMNSLLTNEQFVDAKSVDEFILKLDKTANKSEMGANAILAISMAVHRVFAKSENLELWQYLSKLYFNDCNIDLAKYPQLMCNIINGGEHADNHLTFQEFMIIPETGSIIGDIKASSEIYSQLKHELSIAGYSTSLGDEGGFAPQIKTTAEVLDFIVKSVKNTNYSGDDYSIGLDCAATEFYNPDSELYLVDDTEMNAEGLIKFLEKLSMEYNITSIEDALSEDDIANWVLFKDLLDHKFYQIGDDLFVTNVQRFKEIGLKQDAANGVLIKLNQIGSVLETCNMINLAHESDYICAISHRSGETVDDFIADLAVASGSKFIKLGAPARGERVAKYNRLLEIYSEK